MLRAIENILHSNHIFVYESWLTECLKYLLTSHNNSHKGICTKVIGQWLHNDLTKISPGCLPLNLNDNTCELKGVYTLQINSIWNFDFYDYYCLKNTKRSKREINRAGQHDLVYRNLVLVMTDGVQEIYGHVLEPIKDLWINTVPGCKMLIIGPVHLRKHESVDLPFLILNDGNCELLGGEVDTLMKASYNHTVNQMNLLKIQNTDSAVTATDRHNGYADWCSERRAKKKRKRKLSNRRDGPSKKKKEIKKG